MTQPAQRIILGCAIALFSISIVIFAFSPATLSQSGRQKKPSPTPSGNDNSKPRQGSSRPSSVPRSTPKPTPVENDADEVVKVTSNLVAVPTTVLDARGVAVANLKLEDFELMVDGQPKPITDLSRADTPVRMAMLFDNSSSLAESREFEKRAAVRFFRNVMRPVDQAAIYSVSTEPELSQPMTNDVALLERTIDSFAKPDGATSLHDAIFMALNYLKPYSGRRIIVIVSDGHDNTSREDHDFDSTLQRLVSDECQVYVVQTGVYDNANVHDLIAERRMQAFSSQTGGAAYVPRTVDDLDSAFAQISADLAQQYILSYYPAADKRDGKYHQIAVRVKALANARVRARKGFLVKNPDRV